MPEHEPPPLLTPPSDGPGLVSIIIPAHNAARFVTEAIRSALAQTYNPIEVIVIDDGSTDATPAIISQMAGTDPRLIPITLPQRKGVSAARNAGLARARGEWIALLDADDQYLPNRIATLLAVAAHEQADLIADNLQMRDFITGAELGPAFPAAWMSEPSDITIRYILERDIAGLYRREMAYIKPLTRRRLLTDNNIIYREDIIAGEDLLFYIACLRAGGRLRLVPEAYYIYAVRPGSISSSGAANIGCRQANEILQGLYDGRDQYISELLALRAAAIDFELLIWHLRHRRPLTCVATARLIPTSFLVAKLVRAARRRLGLGAPSPAASALERIKSRHSGQSVVDFNRAACASDSSSEAKNP
jgi:GT2 family glycosyltransferase